MNDSTEWTIGFNIAPLTKIDAARIFDASGKDPFQTFILVLAVVYNDLKDLLIFQNWLDKKPLTDSTPSPFNGQWSGMSLHIARLIFGVLHEFFELLKKSTAVLNSPEMQALLALNSPKTREHWKTVVAVAKGKADTDKSKLARFLRVIRNNFSYHYYQPNAIMNGFRQKFVSDPKSPKTEFAFCSLGNTMEETRFYFADAAVQAGIYHFTEELGEMPSLMSEYETLVNSLNNVLVQIISSYIIRYRKALL